MTTDARRRAKHWPTRWLRHYLARTLSPVATPLSAAIWVACIVTALTTAACTQGRTTTSTSDDPCKGPNSRLYEECCSSSCFEGCCGCCGHAPLPPVQNLPPCGPQATVPCSPGRLGNPSIDDAEVGDVLADAVTNTDAVVDAPEDVDGASDATADGRFDAADAD